MAIDELRIKQYREFYRNYLIEVKDKNQKIQFLRNALVEFKKEGPKHAIPFVIRTSDETVAQRVLLDYLKENFPSQILNAFNKEFKTEMKSNPVQPRKDLFTEIFSVLREGSLALKESGEKQFLYQCNLIEFIIDCLACEGLHPTIKLRNKNQFNRYVVIVEHGRSMGHADEIISLIDYSQLNEQVLLPFMYKKPLIINGRSLDLTKQGRLQVFSTLFNDEEIQILALNKKVDFNEEVSYFAYNFFENETNALLKNPHVVEIRRKGAKSKDGTPFIEFNYITELKKIKSKMFGLKRLVALCEEINSAAYNENYITLAMLQRALIDYVPPIFGLNSFAALVNNYSGAGKSFMESMAKLEGVRKIADMHIHLKAQKDDLVPTFTQVNFSQQIDLLLSQVLKILKNAP